MPEILMDVRIPQDIKILQGYQEISRKSKISKDMTGYQRYHGYKELSMDIRLSLDVKG